MGSDWPSPVHLIKMSLEKTAYYNQNLVIRIKIFLLLFLFQKINKITFHLAYFLLNFI
jgi:hypothetical protein